MDLQSTQPQQALSSQRTLSFPPACGERGLRSTFRQGSRGQQLQPLNNCADHARVDWLRQMKIDAHPVGSFAVLGSVVAGDCDDLWPAREAHLAQPADDLPPIHSRQAKVQKNHFRRPTLRSRQRGRTIKSDLNVVPRNAQQGCQAISRIDFIFDDKNFHSDIDGEMSGTERNESESLRILHGLASARVELARCAGRIGLKE